MNLPYDALADWSGTACQSTASINVDSSGTGSTYAEDLAFWLTGVYNAGLTPEIAFGPGTLPSDPAWPDATTSNGANNYVCGIEAIVRQVQAWNLPVYEWEAWNEPNDGGNSVTQNNPYGYRESPLSDAYLWIDANSVAGIYKAGTVAALTLNNVARSQQQSYVEGFFSDLNNYYANAKIPVVLPSVVAVHDYNDVDFCAAQDGTTCSADITNLENAITTAEPGYNYSVWITEAGLWMSDYGSYLLPTGGSKPVYQEYNGSPTREAEGGSEFKYLATLPRVTETFWYELQSFDGNNNNPDVFDSALVGADGTGYDDGNQSNYSTNRPSVCVLLGVPASTAASSNLCNDVIGFTSPCANTGQTSAVYDQPASQITEPSDISWEFQGNVPGPNGSTLNFGYCAGPGTGANGVGGWRTTYTFNP